MVDVFGAVDLLHRLDRARVSRLRQRRKHIRRHVESAPLLAGLGKHVPQRGPEPCAPSPIARTGPASRGACSLAADRPRTRWTPGTVGQRDEFLAASARTPATMLAAGQDSKMAAGQLGHTGTVVAKRYYVARTHEGPDARALLERSVGPQPTMIILKAVGKRWIGSRKRFRPTRWLQAVSLVQSQPKIIRTYREARSGVLRASLGTAPHGHRKDGRRRAQRVALLPRTSSALTTVLPILGGL